MASFEPNAPSCVCPPGQCECESYGSTDEAVEELLTNSEELEQEVPSNAGLEMALQARLQREGGGMPVQESGTPAASTSHSGSTSQSRVSGKPHQLRGKGKSNQGGGKGKPNQSSGRGKPKQQRGKGKQRVSARNLASTAPSDGPLPAPDSESEMSETEKELRRQLREVLEEEAPPSKRTNRTQ